MAVLNIGYLPDAAITSTALEPNSQDSELEDIRLMYRVTGGDRVALANFYDKYAALLFSLASHILNDATESENVLLHSFNQIWEKAFTFDKNYGSPLYWILSIVHDEALKTLKMKQFRLISSNRKSVSKLIGSYDLNTVDSDNFSDLQKNQMAQYLMLSPKQRETIELVYFKGFSRAQAAQKLNETSKNINTYLCDGLMALSDFRL